MATWCLIIRAPGGTGGDPGSCIYSCPLRASRCLGAALISRGQTKCCLDIQGSGGKERTQVLVLDQESAGDSTVYLLMPSEG